MYLFYKGATGTKLIKNYTDVMKDGINMRTENIYFLFLILTLFYLISRIFY